MYRLLLVFGFIMYMGSALAEGASSSLNLAIPSMPSTYGQDSIRTQEGLDCKNAIGGATNVEFGVTGIVDNAQGPFSSSSDLEQSKDIGVYARIIIPLDAPKERINCNTLYQLELQKKRLELMKLQQELERLKALQFENGKK